MKRTQPQLERRRPRDPGDREAFVTYSRLEADELDPPRGAHELDDSGPLYDAVEVPAVERPRPRPTMDPRLDVRAERDPTVGFDPLEPPSRPRRIRYLVMVGLGVIAVVAGVGILLSSVGSSTRVETSAATPAPESVVPDLEGETVDTGRTVREIPLGTSAAAPAGEAPASETAALPEPEPSAPVAPPTPRPRPEPTATVSVEPAAVTAPATQGAPPADLPAPQAGEEDFIRRIEQTLSRIDAVEEPAPALPQPAAPGSAVGEAPPPPGTVPEPQTEVLLDDDVLPAGEDIIIDGEGMMLDSGAEQSPFPPTLEPLPVPPGASAPAVAGPAEDPIPLFDGLVIDPVAPANDVPPRFVPPADIPGEEPAPLN